MNLSHVERYFSDFLSAIESDESIPMHEEGAIIDGVPARLSLPKNFFVIGTVNVDETTYMFSPKVLDRANVLEFRVEVDQFTDYIKEPKRIDIDKLKGKGAKYGSALVAATDLDVSKDLIAALDDEITTEHFVFLQREMEVLFRIFQNFGWDFGFRVGKEVMRFVYYYKLLSRNGWSPEEALDAQIIQKLMPKLNGSEGRLNGIVKALAWYCSGSEAELHPDKEIQDIIPQERAKAICSKVGESTSDDPKTIQAKLIEADHQAKFPLSMIKTVRMWNAVKANGFTSFAEN